MSSVEVGFNIDCNGASVGSIIGMRGGMFVIEEKWLSAMSSGIVQTNLKGHDRVSIDDFVAKALKYTEL